MMNVFNSAINESTPPTIGILPSGLSNQITDIAGVHVGQVTLQEGAVQTGVTVITPHTGDIFTEKVAAGVSIINGFGKSMGLIQLEELGVIETPIALTNTFAVPIVAQAQIKQAIQQHPQIGREWATINPLVLECNDGYLNDLHAFAIEEKHYQQAYSQQSSNVQQGSVGAGRGMRSFGLKGGIGTASRYSRPNETENQYLVGALVLSNFGSLPYLQIDNSPLGKIITQLEKQQEVSVDKGSIIIILATDAPLDARQLKRLSLRAGAGLARTGSNYGHGSGDIAIAFSTTQRISQHKDTILSNPNTVHETVLNDLFNAAAEATEQAIINALWYATDVTGRDNQTIQSLLTKLKSFNLM